MDLPEGDKTMALKDAKDIKSNFSKIVSGTTGLAKGLLAAYLIAIPVHDIGTGESLLSKTWNSTVVAGMDGTDTCKSGVLEGSFFCVPRGDGKGLGTLVPSVLKPGK